MGSMALKTDLYEVLGVARGATSEDIRKAFRALARQHHPDVNGGDPASAERFKDIKHAYEVLSDTDKRRYYDEYGQEGPAPGPVDAGGFGVDLFDLFFGGSGGRRSGGRNAPQQGSDLRYDLQITLEEAATGVETTFSLDREQSCSACTGTGSRDGERPAPCSTCNGTGQVRRTQQTMLGSFSTVATCPRCSGQGSVVTDPCPECRGSGRERVPGELTVRIPPGVDTGNRIQMAGEGDGGQRNGPPGDLYVFIHVAAHDRFERQRNDLITEFPISFAQAALGDTVEAPTLQGITEIRVPAGTQAGHVFRVRGQGMPDVNGRGRGDLHVIVRVPVPEKLNDRQRRAIEELAAAFSEKHDAKHTEGHGIRGLFEKAKEVFDFEK